MSNVDSTQTLQNFCQVLIHRLREYSTNLESAPQTEKELECNVLWRVVDELGSYNLDVRRHPFGQRDLEKQWAEVKDQHCAYAFGMRHTADMYVLVKESQAVTKAHDPQVPGGISIDVKLAKPKRGSDALPNAELQTLIGQCVLQRTRHDYSIGIFGHLMPLGEKFSHDDTSRLEKRLAAQQIYVVRLDFSNLV